MNEPRITVSGNVVAEPEVRTDRNGGIFTTMRVANTPVRRGPDGRFADLTTNYFSIIAFGPLAANVAAAVRKGQPVVVEGNLSIKPWVTSEGQPRLSAEIDADHIGHDLKWGRAAFERVSRAAALGIERTSDPFVAAARQAMEGDDAALRRAEEAEPRPANVDENGEVHDLDLAESLPAAYGDPDSDDYEATQIPA